MLRPNVFAWPAATAIVALVASAVVRAEPLFDPDSGPLTGLFGWPTAGEQGRLTASGRTEWRLHATLASHSVVETASDQSLMLDGETTRLWLEWRQGVSEKLELGVMLPWTWHESGSLDSAIRGWHDFFGLPQGNRPTLPEDRLLFEYRRSGAALARLDRNSNGVGDLRIDAGLALRDDPRSPLALRVGLKLPTGDSDALLGSGGTDFSVGLAGEVAAPWDIEALSAFYQVSAIRLGTPEVLSGYSRDFAGQLSAGLEYELMQGFAITLQSGLRSAPFDLAVDPLGEWAMWLSAGARLRLAGDWQLSFGFSEDIRVESVPDVTFLVTLWPPSYR